jgi:hypothetical protein
MSPHGAIVTWLAASAEIPSAARVRMTSSSAGVGVAVASASVAMMQG